MVAAINMLPLNQHLDPDVFLRSCVKKILCNESFPWTVRIRHCVVSLYVLDSSIVAVQPSVIQRSINTRFCRTLCVSQIVNKDC